MNNSLQEENAARELLERRLSELRAELERLQAENSSFWSRSERLETEKINLERENKKIKAELMDAEMSGKVPTYSNGTRSEAEVRMLQQELAEKTKVKRKFSGKISTITDECIFFRKSKSYVTRKVK